MISNIVYIRTSVKLLQEYFTKSHDCLISSIQLLFQRLIKSVVFRWNGFSFKKMSISSIHIFLNQNEIKLITKLNTFLVHNRPVFWANDGVLLIQNNWPESLFCNHLQRKKSKIWLLGFQFKSIVITNLFSLDFITIHTYSRNLDGYNNFMKPVLTNPYIAI